MIETWVTLTDADVFSAESVERKAVTAAKRRDDLADMCSQVTAQIRQAYILSNREIGPDGTIPEGLKARAIALALWRFVSEGVPSLPLMQTKERREAATSASSYVDKISSAEIGKVSAPSVAARPALFSQREQDGI